MGGSCASRLCQACLDVLEEAAGVHAAFLDFEYGVLQDVIVHCGSPCGRTLVPAISAASIPPPDAGQGRCLRNQGGAYDQQNAKTDAVQGLDSRADSRHGKGNGGSDDVHVTILFLYPLEARLPNGSVRWHTHAHM